MKDFQEKIEKEIESCEDLILNTTWNEFNVDSLKNIVNIMNNYKTTLKHIKQFKRGLL